MVAIKSLQKNNKMEKLKNGKTKKPKKVLIPKTTMGKTSTNNKIVEMQAETIKTNKIKYKMPSKIVNENIISLCLNALEKLVAQHDKKNAIFGDETQVFMEIRCIKLLNTRSNLRFVLPHSTVATSSEICLITPDLKKGRKVDHEPTIDHWEQLIREAGVTGVKTVLPMRQLRVEYDQFELKRRLLTQHDLIMVDTRILNHVSHLLGKMFFKKHNMLIPVKINEKKDLKKNIDIGVRTVMLRLNAGQTSTILVGHTAMPQNHIKENILALIKQLKNKFPGGEQNIRSLSIKLPLSLSLPLYLSLRPSNSVQATKIKKDKPKSYVVCEGELSTKLSSIVSVAPDGTIHVKKQAEHESDTEDEENNVDDNDLTMSENED